MTQILLIDDDNDDILLFKEALQFVNSTIKCFIARNGEQAIQFLKEHARPDLIFLDINMPIMNGHECLYIIKSLKQYKNIPVVMYSTSNSPFDIEATRKTGANKFLIKPAHFDELCEKLRKALSFPLSTEPDSYVI
jgi:CheY-like chemotaxis protein